jgi:hypothetical protein
MPARVFIPFCSSLCPEYNLNATTAAGPSASLCSDGGHNRSQRFPQLFFINSETLLDRAHSHQYNPRQL